MPQIGNKKYGYDAEGMQDYVQDMKKRQSKGTDPFASLDKTQVANLQNFLQHYGYYEGKIDSIPGPKTKKAFGKYAEQTDIPVQSEGMRGAGLFGKDKQGNKRTPGRDLVDYLKSLRD